MELGIDLPLYALHAPSSHSILGVSTQIMHWPYYMFPWQWLEPHKEWVTVYEARRPAMPICAHMSASPCRLAALEG